MVHPYDVLVIGGGLAGMAAAVSAAEAGADVVLLEGSDHIGGKVLAAGEREFILTNEKAEAGSYYDADPAFVTPVLQSFSNQDVQQWFTRAGLDLRSKEGRISPVSGEAVDILDALRLQMNRFFVRVEHYQKVVEIHQMEDGLFEVVTVKSEFYGKKIILAAGSKALAQTDSGDLGYLLAQKMGMKVKKALPALTHLRLNVPCTSDWDGLCADGSITLFVDGQQTACAAGRLELTGYGICGVPAFQVSRYAARALDEGKEVTAEISFLPGMTAEEAYAFLQNRIGRVGEYLARDFLIGVMPKKLARILIREAGIRHSRPISYLKEREIKRLAEVLTALPAEVSGHGNFRQSLTCTGGVLTSEADPATLESRAVKGVYLAGEILDVDGMYEGFNQQWAFSSGFTAGKAAAGKAKEKSA